MNKKALLDKVIAKLESDRATLAEVAQHTYEAATHEESEAEDQYDTRGLEASYLAGAQAKRVADLEQLILNYRFMELKNFSPDDPIATTALVELEFNGRHSYCFLLPKGGGMSLQHEGKTIQIITPQAPLGEALMGRKAGDVALLDKGADTREYEILSVI